MPMALITWAFVALVLVIVIVLVGLKVTQGATAVPAPAVARAPAAVVRAVAEVPDQVFDAVGAPGGSGPTPQVLSGQPPLVDGSVPEVAFVGAEFSPYSAAARWALVAALSRFGTFTDLGSTSSSSAEVFPHTATFTFDGTTYRSRFVSLVAVEAYGDTPTPDAPGGFPALDRPGSALAGLLRRDDGASTGDGASGPPALPLLDVGNRVLFDGAAIGFSPGLLRGESMSQIAASLGDPTSASGRAVVGAANELSAAVCAVTGQRPAAVCSSAGVRAGAARLGLGAA